MFSLRRLLKGLAFLAVAGLIFVLLFWGETQIPLPAPFDIVIHGILVLAVIAVPICILLWIVGFEIFKGGPMTPTG